jgi:hypothetical protein
MRGSYNDAMYRIVAKGGHSRHWSCYRRTNMDTSEAMKRIMVRESIESQCKSFVEEKINRYLEIEHQGIIGGHYFAPASSECIYLYRDGYFIGAVMMSHAINEGIIKFVAERNGIERNKTDGTTKTVEDLINDLREKNIISSVCGDGSMRIWRSYRNDIHHMNPTVANIDFKKLAQQNLIYLSTIEKEIFDFKINNGAIVPTQPKYWDIKSDGTAAVFLRLD